MARLGDACHRMESAVADGLMPSPEDRAGLRAIWTDTMKRVESLVGTGAIDGLVVSDAQLRSLVTLLAERADHEEILHTVEMWRAEPTEVALSRLAAQAHRVAGSLGKRLDVQVKDNQVYLRPGMFDTFWSTLVHVMRNAAYHGIEEVAERVDAGKPEAGSVWLGTEVRDDGRLEVLVRDDGRGIDVETLLAKARARGLDVDSVDDPASLVFADGLSTSEVNDVAGRGVGLSVVALQASKLGGRAHVMTERGKGTAFRFSFPPTYLASQAS